MADNFGDLQRELTARGYDYLAGERAKRYVNRGYQMLAEEYPWDFLKTTTTGTAPLQITDLREVLSVADTTNDSELYGEDPRQIVSDDPNGDATGNPECWYLDGDTIRVYPASVGASLSVTYIRVPAEMTADSDEPLVPQRYRNLITDAAVYLALKDDDEYANAAQLKTMYDAEVLQMLARLSIRDLQSPPQILVDPYC